MEEQDEVAGVQPDKVPMDGGHAGGHDDGHLRPPCQVDPYPLLNPDAQI